MRERRERTEHRAKEQEQTGHHDERQRESAFLNTFIACYEPVSSPKNYRFPLRSSLADFRGTADLLARFKLSSDIR
jgi:hypothetical protein